MAEVVGTIAAAVQLAETTWKLSKLRSEIRDVPDEISGLIEEVLALADLLADIRNIHVAPNWSLGESRAWKQCHQQLKSAVDTMGEVTTRLNSLLVAHKTTGSLRVYLKRDELTRCKDKLERTKTTMLAAQQAYSTTLLVQQNELLLNQVRAIAMEQQALKQTVQMQPVPNPSQVANTGDCHDLLISPAPRTFEPGHVPRSKQSSTYDVCLPRWIYRKGFQMLINRSNHSWGVTFRSYNRLSNQSDLFKSAWHGDFVNVRRMLENRLASPFDVDSDNHTLLHVAASFCDYDMCKLLIDHGVDPARKNDAGSIALLDLAQSDGWYVPIKGSLASVDARYSQTFELLLNAYSAGCFENDDFEALGPWSYAFLPPECMRTWKRIAYPSYEALDKRHRAVLALSCTGLDPTTVSETLGHDLTVHQAYQLLTEADHGVSHRDVIWEFARDLPILNAQHGQEAVSLGGWRARLRDVLSFERQSTSTLVYESYLVSFLRAQGIFLYRGSSAYLDQDTLTKEIRVWVAALKECGLDLDRYGRAEKTYHLSIVGRGILDLWVTDAEFALAIRYITYGPEVEDWNAHVIPVLQTVRAVPGGTVRNVVDKYVIVGQFWRWVENPELVGVPGAYLDDDDDDDEDDESDRTQRVRLKAPCF